MKIAALAIFALLSTACSAAAQVGDVHGLWSYDSIRPYDFSNPLVLPGTQRNVSLGYAADPGKSKTQDVSLGGQLRYAAGQISQNLNFKLDIAQAKATKRRKEVFADYDATFNLKGGFYGFVTGRYAKHGLAETADEIADDYFVGAGAGYRIIDTEKMGWRLQAGIGASYLKDGIGDTMTEPGVITSSRLFYEISPTVIMSDDTDVLKTESALRITNDLGMSFKMSSSFATRVSYLTDYNDMRADRADNRLGVSLVMKF